MFGPMGLHGQKLSTDLQTGHLVGDRCTLENGSLNNGHFLAPPTSLGWRTTAISDLGKYASWRMLDYLSEPGPYFCVQKCKYPFQSFAFFFMHYFQTIANILARAPEWTAFDNFCYNFLSFSSGVTWQDAEDACQNLNVPSHLAGIQDYTLI